MRTTCVPRSLWNTTAATCPPAAREDVTRPRTRDVDSALVRDLADDDRAFGVDGTEVA